MFTFNFNNSSSSEHNLKVADKVPEENALFSEEISAESQRNFEGIHTNTIEIRGIKLQHVTYNSLLENLKESLLLQRVEDHHSDLLSDVYEGGLKIWECTYDLATYLVENGVEIRGKSVLDLGCGAGVLGMLCMVLGARCTTFQDFNKEVIEHSTIPNVKLNGFDVEKAKFFCGDWTKFSELCTEKFDFILTSETIYNVGNYEKLLQLFRKLIKPNGNIFIAAKSYYFGVGGGVEQFKHFLKEEDLFNITTKWKCTEGAYTYLLQSLRNPLDAFSRPFRGN